MMRLPDPGRGDGRLPSASGQTHPGLRPFLGSGLRFDPSALSAPLAFLFPDFAGDKEGELAGGHGLVLVIGEDAADDGE